MTDAEIRGAVELAIDDLCGARDLFGPGIQFAIENYGESPVLHIVDPQISTQVGGLRRSEFLSLFWQINQLDPQALVRVGPDGQVEPVVNVFFAGRTVDGPAEDPIYFDAATIEASTISSNFPTSVSWGAQNGLIVVNDMNSDPGRADIGVQRWIGPHFANDLEIHVRRTIAHEIAHLFCRFRNTPAYGPGSFYNSESHDILNTGFTIEPPPVNSPFPTRQFVKLPRHGLNILKPGDFLLPNGQLPLQLIGAGPSDFRYPLSIPGALTDVSTWRPPTSDLHFYWRRLRTGRGFNPESP